MSRNFERKTSLGKTVAEILLGPCKEKSIQPIVVDAGARNGMFDIADSYAEVSKFIGFEPNREEYDKLVNDTTDANVYGYQPKKFQERSYFQTALWSKKEEREFYITVGAGACTLMGHADTRITGKMYRDNDGGAPYGSKHTEVVRSEPVPCEPLDELIDETIDYLKIDVEGAEYDILLGAKRLLEQKKILFIKSEFTFTPCYERHPVLGHQHVLLDEMGLRLLVLDDDHSRYTRYPTPIPVDADRRLVYSGDAYFVLDPEKNNLSSEDLYRLGVISINYGFSSFGFSLVKDSGFFTDKELEAIEEGLAYLPLRARMKSAWMNFPDTASRVYWCVRNFIGVK